MPEKKKPAAKKPRVAKAKAAKAVPKAPRKPVIEAVAPKPAAHPTVRRTYVMAVGRRKSAVARVRLVEKGSGQFKVNGKEVDTYFTTFETRKIARDPFGAAQFDAATADISIKVNGGGVRGQSEAVRLGISRILVKMDAGYRLPLKRAGFLTRDPRVKERKKYGLKRARRAPQWQKR